LFAAILDAFSDLGVSPATVSQDLDIDYDLTVHQLRTAEQTKELLARLAAYARSILDSRNLPVPLWKMRDFKQHVARHYREKSLSVGGIAAHLSISASYLTKLAKRYLERSVVGYITDYRMERAKELLATSDLMTYEIAEATGFSDARYFSSIFRRRIGVTPTEYRNKLREKIERA
jgi:two-component system response regulator YesN